ncbi:MAG: hypothetical protein SGBAC_007874 [Bacillariaceae sp.]
MPAVSFPTCLVLAGIVSFMMEDTSSFLLSEMIFGVFVFVTYFWLVESKSKSISISTSTSAFKADAEDTLRDITKEQRETMRAQAAEIELAQKQAELQARKEMEAEAKARAEQEAEEAIRLKLIEEARLEAEAQQAARLKEAEEAKARALEEERSQKELEEAARLHAEAKEAARLKAEMAEAAREQAESEAKLKAEEEAARIQAVEAEARKLEQIEKARALAEAEQAARLLSEAESKNKFQAEEAARIEAEEKERLMAEQKLKDEADQEALAAETAAKQQAEEETESKAQKEVSSQLKKEEQDASEDFEEEIKLESKNSLDSTSFHGSMGDLGNNADVSGLSMRVRVLNETTGRSKDLVVPVTPDLTIDEAIYSNLKVREAGVRKWSKDIAREVKQKTSEVVCLLLNPRTAVNVIHTYSIADMKETSTEAMHTMASPEVDQTVRLMLGCRKINNDGEAQSLVSKTPVIPDHEQDVDKSGFFSINDDEDDGDESFANQDEFESKENGGAKASAPTVNTTIPENAETDTVENGKPAKEMNGGSRGSPKGNASVDGDGGQSVSDSSTFSSRSLEEKRRRKRELEAKRLSVSPSMGNKATQAVSGFSLSRFFSRQQQREKSPE